VTPRRPVVAGNWKMHTIPEEACALAGRIDAALSAEDRRRVEVILCPPAIALTGVKQVLGPALQLGAQNMHWLEEGAYTGEISPRMLVGRCGYVIIGHSERRQHFGETNETVQLKVRAALAHGLTPIICVGESLALREAGQTHDWVSLQVRGALHGAAPDDIARVIVAYEPIWAIGTGQAATGEDANAVATTIRHVLASLGGAEAAVQTRIQYGGSVTAANAGEFLHQLEIDGALVGGASLKPDDFARIVQAAARTD
jgi:triosephosphate isomerase